MNKSIFVLLLQIWTSEYKRTIQTADTMKDVPLERWKALNEIDAVRFHFFNFIYNFNKFLYKKIY